MLKCLACVVNEKKNELAVTEVLFLCSICFVLIHES